MFYQNNLIGKDAILKRNEWKEVAKMLGQPGCKFMKFVPGTKHFSIHGEVLGEYADPEDIPLIWMNVPDQETANKLEWISILPDDKPYIAQVPYDTNGLEVGTRISIPFVGDERVDDESGESSVFRVTRVYMISRFPNCRMVQLAPEVKSKLIVDKMDTEEEENKSYSFLKVDQNS